MRLVSKEYLGEEIVRQTAVPAGVAPSSMEVVAALVRRAAGFACPCPAKTLINIVQASAAPWLGDDPRDAIWDAFNELVLNGDFVEIRTGPIGASSNSVFLAAPGFVTRESGVVFLHGVVPDHQTGLPPEMAEAHRHRGVVRWLEPRPGIAWAAVLPQLGFAPLSPDRWFGAPPPISAREHCTAAIKRLSAAPAGGDLAALEILDPVADPTFYNGRWKRAADRAGRFVGRRERLHGAPIWCYAEIGGGQMLRLLDLHDDDDPNWGPDAGRHLQMALDACAGTPQRFSVRSAAGNDDPAELAVDFFSPIPNWAERRLLAVGRRSNAKGRGALFTIMIPRAEVDEEVRFLERALWLSPFE